MTYALYVVVLIAGSRVSNCAPIATIIDCSEAVAEPVLEAVLAAVAELVELPLPQPTRLKAHIPESK